MVKQLRPRRLLAVWLFVYAFSHAVPTSAGTADPGEIRLVLLITVDQLRGDFPWRFRDRLSDSGFRYLMDNGVSWTAAHYQHATTFTAVGHATIATGANSAQHGIVGNDWWEQGRRVYCVGDRDHRALGSDAPGASPVNLRGSTFGDELVVASGGRSRVFAVSVKDRGAILLGGHRGKAFWYDTSNGRFVSSSYYYEQLPAWVEDWNTPTPADRYEDWQWTLIGEPSAYIASDDRPFEKGAGLLDATFPHALSGPAPARYSALRFTPAGDRLTLEFARRLIDAEHLGAGEATDVLAISFSSSDYIGHAFGPGSLEAEDNFLQLDRLIGELLRFIDQRVGLERTLIVLTADHGTDAIPELRTARGIRAGRHRPDMLIEATNEWLGRRFGTDRPLVRAFFNPALYLDLQAVAELGLDTGVVRAAVAQFVAKRDGFDYAFTRDDILAGRLPSTPLGSRVAAAFHPERSGDVILVQSPFWYLYGDADRYSAMHGSPYAYDTHVPLMMAGPGIAHAIVRRPVSPRDIAPTLSTLLGVGLPALSTGAVLAEAFDPED